MSAGSPITLRQDDQEKLLMNGQMGRSVARSAWLINSLIFIIVFIYYSNIFSYLEVIGILPFPPYLISIVAMILIIMIILCKNISKIFIHPIIFMSLLVISIEMISYLFHNNNINGQKLLFVEIYLLLLIISLFILLQKIPGAILSARIAILSVAIMTVVLGFYELFNPFVFLPPELSNPGRISVFFINPNRCGIALVLALILCIEIVPSKLRSIFLLFMISGIIITFSRAAILSGIFVIILMMYFSIIKKKQIMYYSIIFSLIIITLIPIIISNILLVKGINIENIIERMDWFSSIGKTNDFSSQERIKVVKRGLEIINYNFLEGIGISGIATWETFPHNMYIYFAVQYGFMGFLMYPAFLLSSVIVGFSSNKWMFISYTLVMLFLGIFSHNLMQEYYVLVSYALIAAMGTQASLNPAKKPAAT